MDASHRLSYQRDRFVASRNPYAARWSTLRTSPAPEPHTASADADRLSEDPTTDAAIETAPLIQR